MTSTPRRQRRLSEPRPVKLWSWPKIIFLYPTMLAAIVGGVGSIVWDDHARLWGIIFVVTFCLNAIVLAFDFPRTASLTLLLAAVAAVLGAVLINQRVFVFFPALQELLEKFNPQANAPLYWSVAATLAVVYVLVWIVYTRFDYWEISPNEIIHHRGLFGDVARYPAPGLELRIEITDIFERVMLGSGRLIIQPENGPPIILETVRRIDEKRERIKELLDSLNVEIVPTDPVEPER